MKFVLALVVILPIIYLVVQLLKKERDRRDRAVLKEEEFLAQMRADPRAVVRSSASSSAPVAPIIIPQRLDQLPATPLDIPTVIRLNEAPIPDITPTPPSQPPTAPLAAAPIVTLAAPRDGLCMVCKSAVDVRANDQTRWGVKVQEPGSERLTWIHFHCLASRLGETQALRSSLAALVAALDKALTGGGDDGEPASAAVSLKDALAQARRALGGTAPDRAQ